MKRVLIITFYWPPSGGSGVQRWLKMSKYLPENGWEPVIYTTENAEYPVEDPSLEKDVLPGMEVIRRPIVEPYTFYKRFLGIKKDQKVKAGFVDETGKKQGWKERLSIWIRGNLFIPDARCWWVKPSVRFLKQYLKAHPVDAIISTGPPHSMHLIAMKLKEHFGITWIADFRDPWTEIDFYHELRLTRWGDRKHHRLEHQVLTQADRVVTVSWNWGKGLERLGAKEAIIIQNGFDWSVEAQKVETPLTQAFTLTHLGVLGPARNMPTLWQALHELAKENQKFANDLKIRLVGQVDQSAIKNLTDLDLMPHTELIPQVPHDQVLELQQSSQVLLLSVNNTPNAKGILTGKLYEYLASGRPILCVGPEDGDAAKVIQEAHAGITVDFDDKERMKKVVTNLYKRYLEHDLPNNTQAKVERYSRKSLARDYAAVLDKLS